MSAPRFMLVAGVSRGELSRPAWPDVTSALTGTVAADGSWVSWRLTGANHRELGRAVAVFPSVTAALAAIADLRAGVDSFEESVVAAARDGRWTWRLALGEELVATSGRPYSRHRECVYNLDAFRAAVPIADVVETIGRRHLDAIPAPNPALSPESEYAG